MRQEGERGMEMTNYGFTGEQKVSYLREPINICIQTYILKPNVDRLGTEQNTGASTITGHTKQNLLLLIKQHF